MENIASYAGRESFSGEVNAKNDTLKLQIRTDKEQIKPLESTLNEINSENLDDIITALKKLSERL